jgi:hypothetical protein
MLTEAQNWPTAKKLITLSVVCLAAFAGVLQALTNSAGFFPQAALYHKTPVELSYSVCSIVSKRYELCIKTSRSLPP